MVIKKVIPIVFLFFGLHYSCNKSIEKNTNETCFSKENFEAVHQFIKTQTKKNRSPFYLYDGVEIYTNTVDELLFIKNGYIISKINKQRGLFSLSIYKSDNDKLVSEANLLFCKLLSETCK